MDSARTEVLRTFNDGPSTCLVPSGSGTGLSLKHDAFVLGKPLRRAVHSRQDVIPARIAIGKSDNALAALAAIVTGVQAESGRLLPPI
jgi:hypothetical protein